jgi:uncharacterized protein (TIGR03067 family)
MRRFAVVAVGVALLGVSVAKTQNPPKPAVPLSPELKALQGFWKPLSIVYEGKPEVAVEGMKKITAVFDKAEYYMYYVDRSQEQPNVYRLAQMNVTLDVTTTPKTFVFECAVGALKGEKRHGIYELAGNELKLCYGPADKPRPTQFESAPGSSHFLEVWARQPKEKQEQPPSQPQPSK